MFKPVLIVDDDPEAYERLSAALGRAGLCAAVTPQIHHCIVLARELAPEVVVLNLGLRDVAAERVLRTLRRHGFRMPVVALSGVQRVDVDALHAAGADLVLPHDLPASELVTCIVALGRQGATARPAAPVPADGGDVRPRDWREPRREEVRFGDVLLRVEARQVWRGGELVELRPKELEVLLALTRRAGRVVSREMLLRDVWGDEPTATARAVDNCIVVLRRKLERTPEMPRHICTVRKVGYRLDLEPIPMHPLSPAPRPPRAPRSLTPYAAGAAAAARDRCA